MRARTKRLYGLALATALVLLAGLLVFYALGRNANLFYTPQTLAERGLPPQGQRIRIGGFVETGSVRNGDGAELFFSIIDGSGEKVDVSYTGLVPDLFREGEGGVATGRFASGGELFIAEPPNGILAKHDENYQPRELEGVERPQTSYP